MTRDEVLKSAGNTKLTVFVCYYDDTMRGEAIPPVAVFTRREDAEKWASESRSAFVELELGMPCPNDLTREDVLAELSKEYCEFKMDDIAPLIDPSIEHAANFDSLFREVHTPAVVHDNDTLIFAFSQKAAVVDDGLEYGHKQVYIQGDGHDPRLKRGLYWLLALGRESGLIPDEIWWRVVPHVVSATEFASKTRHTRIRCRFHYRLPVKVPECPTTSTLT